MIKRWLYRLFVWMFPEVDRWRIKFEEGGTLIESLRRDISWQQEQILKQIVENNQLKAQLAQVSIQVVAAKLPVAPDPRVAELEEQLRKLEGDLKEAYQANDLLESGKNLLEGQLAQSAKQIENLTEVGLGWKSSYLAECEVTQQLKNELSQLSHEVSHLEQELSTERALSASLAEGHEKLRAELAGAQDVIAGLNATVDGLTKQQASLDELVKMLDEKNTELEKECERRLQEYGKEKTRADQLQHDIDETLRDLNSMRRAMVGEQAKSIMGQSVFSKLLTVTNYMDRGAVVSFEERDNQKGSE